MADKFTEQYITADTHFGHPLMLRNRPFLTIEEMDEHLIKQWNDTVADHDIVWHLGDFSFRNADRTAEIFSRLKGRKRLVFGNHDVDNKGNVKKSLLNLNWDREPTQMCQTKIDGHRVWLCHYSMQSWPARHYGAYHFFGHSHGQLDGIGMSRDVGVDAPDVAYTPKTFRQLITAMPKYEQVVA